MCREEGINTPGWVTLLGYATTDYNQVRQGRKEFSVEPNLEVDLCPVCSKKVEAFIRDAASL